MDDFKVSDTVFLSDNIKGKIVNITRPLGTYQIYHVQSLNDGSIHRMAKHQLIKLDNEPKSPPPVTNSVSSPPELDLSNPPELDIDLLQALFTGDFECRENNAIIEQITKQAPATESLSTDPQPQKQAPASTRFVQVDENDVQQFINENENQNTMRKTLGHIKLFQSFLTHNGELREIYTIPPCDLDPLLSKFILSIRRKDGGEYEPSYIRGIVGSVERHLKRHWY